MHVSIEVDLDDTVGDGLPEVFNRASGATVENKELQPVSANNTVFHECRNGLYHWLVMLCVDLLLDENLVLLEESGLKLDVSGLVSNEEVSTYRIGSSRATHTLRGHCQTLRQC